MKKTTKIHVITCLAAISTIFASCQNYDDFEFTGTVIDYEECTVIPDLGYAIALTTPDSIGAHYTTRTMAEYDNVVVVYGADRLLSENDKVSGRIYLDPNYSKSECYFHIQRDAPEAHFTKLKVIK